MIRRTTNQVTRWDTQDHAYSASRPIAIPLQWRLLELLELQPRTCEELEDATGLPHQTVSPAVNTLMRNGEIRTCGKRPTRSGRLARIWEIMPAS